MNRLAAPLFPLLGLAVVLAIPNRSAADSLVVDGPGRGPGSFATLGAALAALNRDDGVADVVCIRTSAFLETNSIAVSFRKGSTDELSIVGELPDGGTPVILFGEGIGEYAVQVVATSPSRLRLKNLTLAPRFTGNSNAPAFREFQHGGVCIRLAEASGDAGEIRPAAAGIELENITVTSSLPGNLAANPAQRMSPYQAHTRWSGGD